MPEKGCFGDDEWLEGEVTDRCPVMYIHEYADIFEAYTWMEKGHLPYKGGLYEQPALLLECVSVIEQEVATDASRRLKRAKK
jgi:hypothetical protein